MGEHSSAPSKLISMKLKEMRSGCNLGAVWHCCGDSKRKVREREIKETTVDNGPGIEGVYKGSFKPGQGSQRVPQRSYTDHELQQRFGKSASGSSGLMNEEQA